MNKIVPPKPNQDSKPPSKKQKMVGRVCVLIGIFSVGSGYFNFGFKDWSIGVGAIIFTIGILFLTGDRINKNDPWIH